jgi:predicted RNase H-like HicB family nuclease
MTNYTYRAEHSRDEDDGRYLVLLPDWPEVAGDGATLLEAFQDIRSALEEAALGRLDRGEDIPEGPARPGKEFHIPLTSFAAMKIALNRWAFREGHGAQAKLARLSGLNKTQIRRALSPSTGGVSASRLEALMPIAGLVAVPTFLQAQSLEEDGRAAG